MGNLKIRDLVSNAIFPPPFETVEYQINNRVIIPSMELREIIVEKYKKDGLKMIDYYLNFPYLAHIYFHDIMEDPYLPIFYKKKCLAIAHIHPVFLDVMVSRIH